MDEQGRQRAATALREAMARHHLGVSGLARRSGVHPRTIRGFLTGTRWPRLNTRTALEAATGMRPGELNRQSTQRRTLEGIPSAELLDQIRVLVEELTRRESIVRTGHFEGGSVSLRDSSDHSA